jgi:DNA-binding NarL/FixJ family response regulator
MRCVNGATADAPAVCKPTFWPQYTPAHASDVTLQGRRPSMPLTIVLVDDDLDFRLIVHHILASASMTIVGEAADGEEGLAVVLRERPDIVITDLVMPRLNGIGLTRRIRQELPETKIILISFYTEDAYRLMASDSGADAFVSKQVIDSSLLPAIRDVIARRLSGGSGPLPPSAGATRERRGAQARST